MTSYLSLERCDGPPCPRCGCQDVKVLERPGVSRPGVPGGPSPFVGGKNPELWGAGNWFDAGRARCNHCQMVFSFRELPANAHAAPLDQQPPAEPSNGAPGTPGRETRPGTPGTPPRKPTECPKCGGPFHVYKTRGGVQYRKCKRCKNKEDGKTSTPA